RNRLYLMAGAGGVGVVLLIVALLALNSGKKTEPVESSAPPVTASPAVHPKTVPAAAPKEGRPEQADKALASARKFADANAADLEGQIREYQKVVWDWEGTPASAAASKEVDAARQR